jgi:endogenous inhibitor of DNA gyrase (YacG/DUF329 family)
MIAHSCPICGRPVDPQATPTMPFCSHRCRLIDLGRWADERYGLPYEQRDEDGDQERPPTTDEASEG